ncbi:MAG: OadG family protein [Treponema sp.]|jgi:oxaloacetate decarboxylase gamma subunit|nr:OadG family protein [Treponema sp.]
MTITVMLEQSGVLTLLGMGIVFGFLVIMIICISTLGKVIHALGWDKDVVSVGISPTGPIVPVGNRTGDDGVISAVIAAAVTEYRKTHS